MRRALLLGTVLAVGLGVVGFAQTLGVTWMTDIVLDMAGGSWPTDVDIISELVVEYIVSDWTFSSETDVFDGAWIDQDLFFAGVLGAFAISGDVEFDPTIPGFASLEVDISVSTAGVSFGIEFDLIPDAVALVLMGGGQAGDVTLSAEVTLGGLLDCGFDFTALEIEVGFPFCCADIEADLLFACGGLFLSRLCVEGIAIEHLPWLTLNACVGWEVYPPAALGDEIILRSGKYFLLEPEIELGIVGCDFDLYYRLGPGIAPLVALGARPANGAPGMGPLDVDGIIFDGIEISCELGGVQFTAITYWGPPICVGPGLDGGFHIIPAIGFDALECHLPSILYGYEDMGFFEAYQIATTDDGCCGPFAFDVTGFFEEDADTLFDFSYIVANFEIQVSTMFTFGMGIETDLEAGTVDDLTFTFVVEW